MVPKRLAFLLKLFLFIIWLLHIAWTFRVIPTLQGRIPVHFGLSGEPDRWGGPASLWVMLAISVILGNFLLLLSGLKEPKPSRFAPPPKPLPEGYLALFMSFCALMVGLLLFTGSLSMAYWSSAGPVLHGLALVELLGLLTGVVIFSVKAVKQQAG
jgi:hypothetical protein